MTVLTRTERRTISLDGVWRCTPQAHQMLKPGEVIEETTDNLPAAREMTLPANWQTAGLDNFHGRVRFEHPFMFDGLPDAHSVWLIFYGVDYYARVWLNEIELGTHAGYFQPFEFDITGLLKVGENRLVVDVSCPKEEPGTVWPAQKLMLKGILSHWDCRPGSWDSSDRTGHEQRRHLEQCTAGGSPRCLYCPCACANPARPRRRTRRIRLYRRAGQQRRATGHGDRPG
ncbi:MAG: hypothetical protein HC828_16850 [Blastochloris sp.]|nr:hypothetical protein [Blastochloris sp.]